MRSRALATRIEIFAWKLITALLYGCYYYQPDNVYKLTLLLDSAVTDTENTQTIHAALKFRLFLTFPTCHNQKLPTSAD